MPKLQDFSIDRIVAAVNAVEDRLTRSVQALQRAEISYALIGGRAAMSWVESVEPSAIRYTPNVDYLICRDDVVHARQALENAGFEIRDWRSRACFVDRPSVAVRSGVRFVFADEFFNPDDLLPTPRLDEAQQFDNVRVIALEALVRMKLTAFRTIDRVHLDDLLGVGLFDQNWVGRFVPVLGARLQEILDRFEPDPDNIGREHWTE
jgi:hypothetical protein